MGQPDLEHQVGNINANEMTLFCHRACPCAGVIVLYLQLDSRIMQGDK